MNYTKMLTAATIVIALFTTSCAKEDFSDYPSNQKTETQANAEDFRRGSDETEIGNVLGIVQIDEGKTDIKNGEVKVFNMDLDRYLETVPINSAGEFTTVVNVGPYVFECFNDGQYVGASEVIVIEAGSTTVELKF